VNNKRLELFGMLAGIPLADRADIEYDYDRCTFFFKILYLIFQRRLDVLANVFAAQVSFDPFLCCPFTVLITKPSIRKLIVRLF
jgi:hypothetical protein